MTTRSDCNSSSSPDATAGRAKRPLARWSGVPILLLASAAACSAAPDSTSFDNAETKGGPAPATAAAPPSYKVLAALKLSESHSVRFLEVGPGQTMIEEIGLADDTPVATEITSQGAASTYMALAAQLGLEATLPTALAEALAVPAPVVAAAPPSERVQKDDANGSRPIGSPVLERAPAGVVSAAPQRGAPMRLESIDYTADAASFTKSFCSADNDDAWCPTNVTWANTDAVPTDVFDVTCLAASEIAGANYTTQIWNGTAWVQDYNVNLVPRQWAHTVSFNSQRQSSCTGTGADPRIHLSEMTKWATPQFTGPQDIPGNVKDWWTNDLEGITHDDSFWYFTASPSGIHSGLGGSIFPYPEGVYWSYPRSRETGHAPAGPDCPTQNAMLSSAHNVSVSLFGSGFSCGHGPFPSPSSLPGRYQLNPWIHLYNHFGDPTVNPDTKLLYIPMENSAGVSKGVTGTGLALGVFDISTPGDPEPLYYLQLPSESPQVAAGQLPWFAFNPTNGVFYSSKFDNASELYKYVIHPECGAGSASCTAITYNGKLPLVSDAKDTPITFHSVQGGKYSPSGKLYLSTTEPATATSAATAGIAVIDPAYHFWLGNGYHRRGILRERLSTIYSQDDELEGVDVLDTAGTGMPGIAGQLHLMMINNNKWPSDDAFYFKHYTIGDRSEL